MHTLKMKAKDGIVVYKLTGSDLRKAKIVSVESSKRRGSVHVAHVVDGDETSIRHR